MRQRLMVVTTIIILCLSGLIVFKYFFSKRTTSQTQKNLQKITFMVPYNPQIQWAAYYSAVYNGYYKNEGLDVEMQYSVKGSPAVIQQVVGNKVDFGLASVESIVSANSKGANVVAVDLIEPSNVFYIVSEKKKNIVKPADLVNKDIGIVSLGGGTYNNLLVLMALSKINKDSVNIIPVGTALVPSFFEGKFDAVSVHLSEKMKIEEKNSNINIMRMADYTDMSSQHIIVSRKFMESNPQLIRSFLKATKKGLEYAVRYPVKAVDMYLSFFPDDASNRATAQKTWNGFIDAYHYKESISSGKETIQYWQKIQDSLFLSGFISNKTDIKKMFSNDYVPL